MTFAGGQDDGNGLNYFHARYYSHRLQRFISQDPLSYDGGDYNLYRYVHNNPHTNSDPSGLYDYGDGEGNVDTLPDVNVTGLRNSFALELSTIRISTSVNGGGDYDPGNGDNTRAFDGLVPDLVAGMFTDLPNPNTPKPKRSSGYCPSYRSCPCGSSSASQVYCSRSRLKPDPEAQGPHSTFKTDASGKVTKYETYGPQNESVLRVDLVGKPHFNKVTQEYVKTPHVHDPNPNVPGNVRSARPPEIPKERSP